LLSFNQFGVFSQRPKINPQVAMARGVAGTNWNRTQTTGQMSRGFASARAKILITAPSRSEHWRRRRGTPKREQATADFASDQQRTAQTIGFNFLNVLIRYHGDQLQMPTRRLTTA